MAKDGLRFLGEFTDCQCDILNKPLSIDYYATLMLNKTNRMFEYKNLPDTMPALWVERLLQTHGSAAVLEHEGNLYMIAGSLGGPPDPYLRGTIYTAANPALMIGTAPYKVINHLPPFDKSTWEQYSPCVYCQNDTMSMGLLPIFFRYATQMTENEISIRCAQINSRSQSVFAANEGPEIQSAKQYMENLEAGKLASVATRPFLDGIKTIGGMGAGAGGSNVIMQLIELQQYLKASWYNEIGLNSNFNMKREYLSEEEVKASADIMLPLVDDMLWQRQSWVAAVNAQWGTDIEVNKSSAWEDKQETADMRYENGQLEEVNSVPDNPVEVNIGEAGGTVQVENTDIPFDQTPDEDIPVDQTPDEDSPVDQIEQVIEILEDVISPDEKEGEEDDSDETEEDN